MASNLAGQGEVESTPTSTMMTDEENTGLSSCQLALQNDLILRNIFGFLPLPDLKACRLVNQKWKQACQDGCVKKCDTIGFLKSVDVNKVDFCKAHRFQEMLDLTELISTSGDEFPCRSYLVECGIAGMVENPEKEGILASFLTAIAPIAEQLWIDKLGGRSLFNGEPPQSLRFPRLKSLELWVGRYSVKECLATNLNLCKEIIRHSPQLGTLELVCTRSESEAANLLITLLESVQGRKLSLHLHGPLNDTLFNKMTGFGLQLRCLWLSFDSGSLLSEDGDTLTKFLMSQSDTLEVLHLRSGKNLKDEVKIINFPRMEKITHLCLEMLLRPQPEGLRFPHISYAEHFPALNSLSLPNFTGWDSIFDFRREPVYTVTSLTLSCHLMNLGWISEAARIFPNVQKLTLPSRGPIVWAAYEAWQKVEELTIATIDRVDGWTWSVDSADSVLFMLDNPIISSNPLALDHYVQPMEFLQNLKVLRLHHKNHLALSDDACRIIMLRLRSLRCLDLSEGSSGKISKEMLQQMRDKFSVLC